jgi:hypothetical protein
MVSRVQRPCLRRRLVIVAAIVAIRGSVALHHSGLHPMDDGMNAMTTAIELCMAVLPFAAAAGALAAPSLLIVRPWHSLVALTGTRTASWLPVLPHARAGPLFLSVMRR